ncbi:hypothetical protein CHELA40_14791 [Chelatococcus asaccharovorans]|nr:hypothetical protein CHELA17_60830 [Chelatococcus asaccharovorans]CAH1679994.1 hypothetical protein CHELA40_14791 [Chelatococcus asaccharovorans]
MEQVACAAETDSWRKQASTVLLHSPLGREAQDFISFVIRFCMRASSRLIFERSRRLSRR